MPVMPMQPVPFVDWLMRSFWVGGKALRNGGCSLHLQRFAFVSGAAHLACDLYRLLRLKMDQACLRPGAQRRIY